eukprot:1424510-Pleurochrysis_carterae.AAC.1
MDCRGPRNHELKRARVRGGSTAPRMRAHALACADVGRSVYVRVRLKAVWRLRGHSARRRRRRTTTRLLLECSERHLAFYKRKTSDGESAVRARLWLLPRARALSA